MTELAYAYLERENEILLEFLTGKITADEADNRIVSLQRVYLSLEKFLRG